MRISRGQSAFGFSLRQMVLSRMSLSSLPPASVPWTGQLLQLLAGFNSIPAMMDSGAYGQRHSAFSYNEASFPVLPLQAWKRALKYQNIV